MQRYPDGVRIEAGPGGLERLVLQATEGEAHVFLHGAHVSHFQPKGERPVLWTSAARPFPRLDLPLPRWYLIRLKSSLH